MKVPAIPQGKIMIQVIATGWHTFGKWYDMDKEEESVAIKLEPPPHWYLRNFRADLYGNFRSGNFLF